MYHLFIFISMFAFFCELFPWISNPFTKFWLLWWSCVCWHINIWVLMLPWSLSQKLFWPLSKLLHSYNIRYLVFDFFSWLGSYLSLLTIENFIWHFIWFDLTSIWTFMKPGNSDLYYEEILGYTSDGKFNTGELKVFVGPNTKYLA